MASCFELSLQVQTASSAHAVPAGSWGSSESWPWPRRDRKCFPSVRERRGAFIYLRLNYSQETLLNKTQIDNWKQAALL